MNLSKFFRKDLKLHERWWHRLAKVCFIIVVLVSLLYAFVYEFENIRYKEVEPLVNRFDAGIVNLGKVIANNERIGRDLNSVTFYHPDNEKLVASPNIYCSTNITDNVSDISETTGIFEYKGDKDLISYSEFKKYLETNSALCITIVNFLGSTFEYYQVQSALGWEFQITSDLYIWRESIFYTAVAAFLNISILLLLYLVLLIFYYKVIIYIIFGARIRSEE